MSMLTRLGVTLTMGIMGFGFYNFDQPMLAIFFMCSAANASWYDPPKP